MIDICLRRLIEQYAYSVFCEIEHKFCRRIVLGRIDSL